MIFSIKIWYNYRKNAVWISRMDTKKNAAPARKNQDIFQLERRSADTVRLT